MSFIHRIPVSEAEGTLQRVYSAAASRAGGVAQIIQVMSQDARTAQASMNFYIQLMKTENALSSARKEMLATVVSNVNDCYY